ncbi:TPA: acetyl-CoA C-acetyltransferase [Streptococcus equi subsp. zooepidemicus]|uniref:acetyl-CoA C-acetyltransferase n=1 Tax=Streptococcus equi TaxID=1336 RepID=UPI0024A9C979|nr:acetyl-CoA C-acetyltransferase [Streptococcus equi]MDI5988938.1 acetyl-CoA C-acetyltransferase [Streptococcus equi subsp. zooepidemicus]HEL0559366.1 acetyl-CoA C-acetyltransferase [Streptococcus equi subsp. zooepidemicus]HEL0585861.1 acetyl-CoA C-acetyltransferase [Streptococcus equi subsp. zooepidemicus]HEL0608958.1 acetyl-CoA C-acetyltransferase [Streptococcus equi subsp. zooepidemicus]HEL0629803.1 acetyl-CoA C-acetyltransferase [Streptococcus equi subsp. zooepidemicus]
MLVKEVVITTAVRTPIGSFGGAFKSVSAVQLGKVVVEALLEKSGVKPEQIDEVIFGNVLHAGLGQNVARQVAITAGIPNDKPAFTVDMVCGSGLKSIELAAQSIVCGDSDIIIAGGTENMSQASYVLKDYRWGGRLGDGKIIDTMVNDGLTDAFHDYHMGITAENIAKNYGISRKAQDIFALASQEKAAAAQAAGRFVDEIIPVPVPQRKGDPILVAEDEYIKAGTTLEKLTALRPAFVRDGSGTVTAGNASGINDGAAAVLLMSRDKAEELGLPILGVIKGYASAGVAPEVMGTGPIPSTQKALAKVGWTVEDLDLVEANEAFASQAISVVDELGLNADIVNVNGGAIALGHPIGASGARILVTLLHEMEKRQAHKGLATLCIGGGQGTSVLIEK